MLRIIAASDTRALERLLASDRADDPALDRRVAAIVADVRRGRRPGAARATRRQFDALDGAVEVTADGDGGAARRRRRARVRRAIRAAARHIRARRARAGADGRRASRWRPGIVVEQRVAPLERVGCYVPGGRYPLPSSLLMTAIPARVAGVAEVIAVLPAARRRR